jgi:hypothetical protein
MADETPGHERIRAARSLFRTGEHLQQVAGEADQSDEWFFTARAAIRTGIDALEFHIQAIEASDGMAEDVTRREPRLLHALTQLQAGTGRLLVDLWQAMATPAGSRTLLAPQVAALGTEMRRVADEEFALLAEFDRSPAAQD